MSAEPTHCVIAGCANRCVGLYTTYQEHYNTRCAEHQSRCVAYDCLNDTLTGIPGVLSPREPYPDHCVQCSGTCAVDDGRPHRFEMLSGYMGSCYNGGIVCQTHPEAASTGMAVLPAGTAALE
jgi:hypothetical protein